LLFYLHLHEHLGEYPDAFRQKVGVVLQPSLAQQLRQTYPQLIRSVDWSLPRGTTRWPYASTAEAFYTITRTLTARVVEFYDAILEMYIFSRRSTTSSQL
jgi:hypothetical protein